MVTDSVELVGMLLLLLFAIIVVVQWPVLALLFVGIALVVIANRRAGGRR